MAKKLVPLLSFSLLLLGFFWSYFWNVAETAPDNSSFSVDRAFDHVENIAVEPHYLGSQAHSKVRNYIAGELEELGLIVQTQNGFVLSKEGIATSPENIIAKIEGTGEGKAVLLMSHYDSAMHSSFGASDAASGVAAILEGLRVFLQDTGQPQHDIIVLFTDGEELDLNGAQLFVQEHPWAKDVGVALNFEARGSGGKPFMLLETNKGNRELLKHFQRAAVPYPVTNSLAYSVYKMLPNDTDLTVLREEADIPGYNFAFIDDHFDYHTATDIPSNLDPESLAHQGSYLLPLLSYFSTLPELALESDEDVVFFSFPFFKMIVYPDSWILPLFTFAGVFIFLVIVIGIKKEKLYIKAILKGLAIFLVALVSSGLLPFLLWELLSLVYPHYAEILQGFTYNGYYYIAAVIFLVIGFCFYLYNRFKDPKYAASYFISPLLILLGLSLMSALYLQGASYLVIPVIFGCLQLLLVIFSSQRHLLLQTVFSLPAIFIFFPFILSFPVALGLSMLWLSGILMVLLWGLLWMVLVQYQKLQVLGFLSMLAFFISLIFAHFKSDWSIDRPKPNSLVYLKDSDRNLETWNTYDEILDSYTQGFFSESSLVTRSLTDKFGSKYGTPFQTSALAKKVELEDPYIEVRKDSIGAQGMASYQVKIAPRREINRIELFADREVDFNEFLVNGKTADYYQPELGDLHIHKNRWTDRLLTYYAKNKDTLRLRIRISKEKNPEIVLYESAYNLQDKEALKVGIRENWMIPKPFVLNDATVIKKTIKLE